MKNKPVLITKKIRELIENNALALCTISVDFGAPHCIGVGFAKVIPVWV